VAGVNEYMVKNNSETGAPAGRPVTDDAIFKVSKEIVVKFIEVGRLTPASFAQTFEDVYTAVRRTVRSGNEK